MKIEYIIFRRYSAIILFISIMLSQAHKDLTRIAPDHIFHKLF